ncbi:MAG: hypothetical protein M3220_06650 [Chloroflexota bacterium]|nr:hypothetical protein [Chloroflexota bacterium]
MTTNFVAYLDDKPDQEDHGGHRKSAREGYQVERQNGAQFNTLQQGSGKPRSTEPERWEREELTNQRNDGLGILRRASPSSSHQEHKGYAAYDAD